MKDRVLITIAKRQRQASGFEPVAPTSVFAPEDGAP